MGEMYEALQQLYYPALSQAGRNFIYFRNENISAGKLWQTGWLGGS